MFLFNRLNRLAKPFGVGILTLTLILTSLGGALLFNSTKPQVAKAAAGNLDPSFNVAKDSGIGGGFYAHINTVNIQSDGQKIIGGNIPYYNGIKINNLARLAVDGALDTTFNTNLGTGFNTSGGQEFVKTTAIQIDGKILVGGDFTTINGTTTNRIARLNADGTLDTTFATNTGTGFNNNVKALALQPDGKILVGGDFTTYQGVSGNGFLRLNSDGTLDTAFMTTIGAAFGLGGISVIAVQPDGKILVGGGFSSFNGTSSFRLARLNGTGTIDTAFTTNIGAGSGAPGFGNVATISVQSDGKILVGGEFDSFNGTNSSRILRLNSDGTNDTAFITNIGTGFNSYYGVKTFAIQSDGKILVGGEFKTFNGSTINFMLRLNSDGTRDTAFSTSGGTGFDAAIPTSYNKIRAITIQSDGKIIVGGGMRAFNGVAANNLVRLNTTGTLDTSFYISKDTGINYYPSVIAVQSDGKIVNGGDFTFYNGVATNRIARLNSDGTLDTNFTTNIGTGFNNTVNTLVIQSDGKILVGGAFTTFNGTTVNRIARLNSDGTLDTAFITNIGTGFNNTVNALAIQADSSIVVGGSFTTFNSIASNYIARLTTTGTADTTFRTNIGTGFDYNVKAIAIQADGNIILGGSFVSFNGTASNRIARLTTTGTADTIFRTNIGTGFDYNVDAIAIQADGNIVVGGEFSTFAGIASKRIARLNSTGTADATFRTNIGTSFNSVGVYALAIQANGKIVVGGWFTFFNGTASNFLLRLNADGTRDTAFDTAMGSGFSSDNVSYSAVAAVALQPDGKLLIGGGFNYFNNNPAKWLVRLNGDSTVINLKVFLTGDYNTSTSLMNTTLNTSSIIPVAQPYNVAPFSYSGTETIGGAVSANVVDWVLVEIRDSTRTTVLAKKAGLLFKNGTIIDPITQVNGLAFTTLALGTNYNIIVRHRNHLAISTATSLTATSTMNIDFTANSNVLGSNQSLLSTGIYGLKVGNPNGDSAIDASDRTLVRNGIESYNTYVSKDLNLDGVVNARDRQMVRLASDISDGI